MADSIPYLIFGFISFLIGVLITRWVFRIDTLIEYQRKQYLLLRLIANKNGVASDDILQVDDAGMYAKRQKQLAKQSKNN